MAEIHYAIADVHGRLDLLDRAYDAIVAHADGRQARVVFLGDAIDRGPNSRGCIDRLIAGAGQPNFLPQVNLMGNHEAFMIKALGGDTREAGHWLVNGGEETLRSYDPNIRPTVAAAKALALPPGHAQWLANLRYFHQTETHIFVHAGIPPGTTVEQAAAGEEGRHWLIWIRYAFLEGDHDFGKHVIHGHSPVGMVDFHEEPKFRTNLDHGAVYRGVLAIGVVMPGARGRPEILRIGEEVEA